MSPRSLSRLIAEGRGPPRIRLGRRLLYNRESVMRWLVELSQDDGRLEKGRGRTKDRPR